MTAGRIPRTAADTETPSGAPPDARIAAIATWLGQFSRTLKTCRLYDALNPNTVKFRSDLCAQMVALLETHGAFRLDFTALEVRCDGHVVMTARSREDSLSMPFYRDGLHALAFHPGAEPAELNLLLDLMLRVTSRASNGADDLVTLLWDADLPHLEMSYVSSETDADLGDESEDGAQTAAGTAGDNAPRNGPLLPWPEKGGGTPSGPARPGTGGGASAGAAAAGSAAMGASMSAGVAPPDEAPLENDAELRSEDWLAGEPSGELERAYESIDSSSAMEVDRFMTEMHADREARLSSATLALVRDAMRTELLEGDRQDLVDLLERVLHEAIASACWPDAREAVDCLTECTEGHWDAMLLVEQLARQDSVVTASLVRFLDGHGLADVHEFVAFARTLGAAAIEWLMGIVAVANHQRTRRTLVHALGEMCGGNPERLGPWLTDPRWFVVRNAVLVMGSAEGGPPAAMFRHLVRHEELRVRQEVVNALANADPDAARPLLLELIHDPVLSVRGAALHQLGQRRNAEASAALLRIVENPEFRKRHPDEVRSVTAALGGCAGDDALPLLEEQLYAPSWFRQGSGPYIQAIARAIARIGTPLAVEILERAASSRAPATRDASRMALQGMRRG